MEEPKHLRESAWRRASGVSSANTFAAGSNGSAAPPPSSLRRGANNVAGQAKAAARSTAVGWCAASGSMKYRSAGRTSVGDPSKVNCRSRASSATAAAPDSSGEIDRAVSGKEAVTR